MDLPPQLSRRSLLAAGAAVATMTVTACGDDDSGQATSAPATPIGTLAGVFPPNDFVVSGVEQRLPFTVITSDGSPVPSIDGPVEMRILRDGQPVTSPVTVTAHTEGARAYLPARLTFPGPGTYLIAGFHNGVKLGDGANIQVSPRDALHLPQVGDAMPVFETPTVAAPGGVDPLCTREPACSFHQVSLGDSLTAARPTVLLVSTPRFCQVTICGPVLETLIETVGSRTDLDVIHAEVYSNPLAVDSIYKATYAPVIDALSLTFEPALFVVRDGKVVERLDSVYDREELEAAIARATG